MSGNLWFGGSLSGSSSSSSSDDSGSWGLADVLDDACHSSSGSS